MLDDSAWRGGSETWLEKEGSVAFHLLHTSVFPDSWDGGEGWRCICCQSELLRSKSIVRVAQPRERTLMADSRAEVELQASSRQGELPKRTSFAGTRRNFSAWLSSAGRVSLPRTASATVLRYERASVLRSDTEAERSSLGPILRYETNGSQG